MQLRHLLTFVFKCPLSPRRSAPTETVLTADVIFPFLRELLNVEKKYCSLFTYRNAIKYVKLNGKLNGKMCVIVIARRKIDRVAL